MSRRRHLTSRPFRRRCGPTAIDGWLLYDFRGLNPIAGDVTGGQPAGRTSGHAPLVLPDPRDGEPRGLVHAIERHSLAHLPGTTDRYAGRDQLEAGLRKLLQGLRRVAMEYSPNCAIPYVSRVDAGTIELVRAAGVEVVSSGDLIQRFAAVWDAGANCHPSGRVREAPPYQGSRRSTRSRSAPATACRRRNTTSSS